MTSFYGYPGQVWAVCFNTMVWLNVQVSGVPAVQTASAAEASYQTLLNAVRAIEVWQMSQVMQAELVLLQQVEALPLTLDTQQQTIFNNRLIAVQNFINDLLDAIPTVAVIGSGTALDGGSPAISQSQITNLWEVADYEVYPAGTTGANLVTMAQLEATVWSTVASQVLLAQGNSVTTAYDAALRMADVAQYVANQVNNIGSTTGFDSSATIGASDPATLWNQMVTIPTLASIANILFSAPYNLDNQQGGAIRYALGTFADQISLLILSLRQPVFSVVNVGNVQQNDSLMDIAARNLQDFEQWSNIAALNGLQAPFTGPYEETETTIAGYGTTVLLPPINGQTYPVGYPTPSYENNVLGVDWYLGPLNQNMITWGGDFQTIAGYANLSTALGRRLQTQLGDLIYHSDYGSRIPPEVGSVQTTFEAIKIAVYGEGCLLSDPRVAAVLSATCTVPEGSNSQVSFVGTVQPIGYGSQSVDVNETLSPLPS